MLTISDKKDSEDVVMWFREAPKSWQDFSLNLSHLDVGFSWDTSLQLDSCENKFWFQYSASHRCLKHEEEQQNQKQDNLSDLKTINIFCLFILKNYHFFNCIEISSCSIMKVEVFYYSSIWSFDIIYTVSSNIFWVKYSNFWRLLVTVHQMFPGMNKTKILYFVLKNESVTWRGHCYDKKSQVSSVWKEICDIYDSVSFGFLAGYCEHDTV